MKKPINQSEQKYREENTDANKEKDELRAKIAQKEEKIQKLKTELAKYHRTTNFDTLTTNNNDPLALKQEVQDLNIMLDEVEQERDNAVELSHKLETELEKVKEELSNNQLNLIKPLQTKIEELEKIVEEKESDIKIRYKWKLRKYKREIEMEKQINQRLKAKLHRRKSKTKDYMTQSDFMGSQKTKNHRKSKKRLAAVESKINDENVNSLNVSNFSNTMRRNKSQTLNGNRVLNMEELLKNNNTPSQMNTQKNLKDYFLKFETTKFIENIKENTKFSPHPMMIMAPNDYIVKQREVQKPRNQSFVSQRPHKVSNF